LSRSDFILNVPCLSRLFNARYRTASEVRIYGHIRTNALQFASLLGSSVRNQVSKLHVFGRPGPVPKSNHNSIATSSPKFRKIRCDHYTSGALKFLVIKHTCSSAVNFGNMTAGATCSSLTNYCGKNCAIVCAWILEACLSHVF
jgi:hypothetical protein